MIFAHASAYIAMEMRWIAQYKEPGVTLTFCVVVGSDNIE